MKRGCASSRPSVRGNRTRTGGAMAVSADARQRAIQLNGLAKSPGARADRRLGSRGQAAQRVRARALLAAGLLAMVIIVLPCAARAVASPSTKQPDGGGSSLAAGAVSFGTGSPTNPVLIDRASVSAPDHP